MSDMDELKAKSAQLTKDLVDGGLIIEAGWYGFQLMVIPENAPKIQLVEMRKAFFAGAAHLFGSLVTTLDADAEVTEQDMERMSSISDELRSYSEELQRELEERQ